MLKTGFAVRWKSDQPAAQISDHPFALATTKIPAAFNPNPSFW